MEVHFTPEQESQLQQMARYAGVDPERLVQDAALRMLSKSIEQLISEQGTRPLNDLSVLSGAIPDEDLEEFVADIYRERK